jgi:hypothetical protein
VIGLLVPQDWAPMPTIHRWQAGAGH